MDELISLKKAAKISGYTPDYLGYLLRTKKLDGKRIGRDWFTTEKALSAYLSTKKFISVNSFLSVKIKPEFKYFFVFFVILIVMVAILVLALDPSVVSYISPGDETKEELQSRRIIIQGGRNDKKSREFEVTSYPSDETGGLEISIEEKE